jgi:acyl dehydratase
MITISGLDELIHSEGKVLGTSDWHEVTQRDVDTFAEVTGDHQWIHVDVERARETPFGGTIAHGYYTLSLVPMLSRQVFSMQGFTFALNYGLNRVRFPAPLRVGDRVRVTVKVTGVEQIPGGAQTTMEMTVEAESVEKPVCVAETLVRAYSGGPAGS